MQALYHLYIHNQYFNNAHSISNNNNCELLHSCMLSSSIQLAKFNILLQLNWHFNFNSNCYLYHYYHNYSRSYHCYCHCKFDSHSRNHYQSKIGSTNLLLLCSYLEKLTNILHNHRRNYHYYSCQLAVSILTKDNQEKLD